MRPDRLQEQDDSSQDSFLDVVANVVGVLIILVMLVGMQASHKLLRAEANRADKPVQVVQTDRQDAALASRDLSVLRSELDEATRQAKTSQREIQELAARVVRINHEAAAHDRHRNELALHRAVIQEDLERRRSQLESHRQREFDVQRQLLESQITLEELTQEQLALTTAPSRVEEVENIPTPLAKTVDEAAIHLRLRNGMVSIVPLEELLSEIQYHVEDIRRQLQSRSEVTETIGPINGYRLRFTVTKRNAAGAVVGPRVGLTQKVVHEQYAEVLPISDDLGQHVEQALMPGAALYEHLQAHRRQPPPVVVWLYTDSFNEFRPLKRALWEMGFSLATRPMQPGTQIGASPHGTKSAAQ